MNRFRSSSRPVSNVGLDPTQSVAVARGAAFIQALVARTPLALFDAMSQRRQ